MRHLFEFKEIPFYFTTSTSDDNGNLPTTLPFTIGIDEETDRIIQCPNVLVSETLELAYKEGSLVTGYMDENGIGRKYADDFIDFILSEIGSENFDSRSILEIGCGTGYLLHRLKMFGAEVLGIEPGPQGQVGKQKYGINIVKDYFPTEQVGGKFDLIIQYAVLEHLENPVAYLGQVRSQLKDKGKILVAVPSSDEEVQYGDISMLFHEHWSYFTQHTLQSTIERSGFRVISLCKAGFGGVWYVIAEPGRSDIPVRHEVSDADGLLSRIAKNQQSFEEFLINSGNRDETVGFYCPGRIINSLQIAQTKNDLAKLKIRFFDDNALIRGHYYPGFPYPIEDSAELFAHHVDTLVIASWTFGEHIRSRLINDGYTGHIMTFKDLMVT